MTIERPNLAGAFNRTKPPVDRAAGLTGLLPPARRPSPSPSTSTTPGPRPVEAVEPADPTPPTVVEPTTTVEATAASTPAPAPASKPARPARPGRTTPVSETADTVANVAVYLEPDLHELTRTTRRSTGRTYDELVVNAFADIDDDTLRRAFTPAVAASTGAAMPARQRRLRGTAGIQIQLRLAGPQRAWLDEKQTAVGAPSRSALIATALRLHLSH